MKLTIHLEDEIDLVPVLVAVVEHGRRLACVVPALQNLAHDEGLEEGAGRGARLKSLWTSPPREVRGKARIEEVELGGLDHPRQHIAVPGLDKGDYSRGDEERQPLLRRRLADADVAGEVGVLEHLSCTGCYRRQEAEECKLVANLRKVLDVSLEIGLNVGGVELLDIGAILLCM